MLAGAVQLDWKGHDRACATQTDIIPTIRPETAAAGAQALDRAGVADYVCISVERQPSIRSAIHEQQSLLAVDCETAWISNTTVLAKRAERPARAIESKEHSVAVAIYSRSAGDE